MVRFGAYEHDPGMFIAHQYPQLLDEFVVAQMFMFAHGSSFPTGESD